MNFKFDFVVTSKCNNWSKRLKIFNVLGMPVHNCQVMLSPAFMEQLYSI